VCICAGTPPAPFFSGNFSNPKAMTNKIMTNNTLATHALTTNARLSLLIAVLDRRISAQLDRVLHHPVLQRLESAWRSLFLLMTITAQTSNVRLKLLDISFDEITRDLDRALEYEHSQLYFKIHSNEFDQAGGEPFGLLLGDYKIDPQLHVHVDTLQRLSHIAAAAFAPLICAAQLAATDPAHADNIMTAMQQDSGRWPDYAALRQLRSSDNSRFLALVVPRIVLRALWGARQHVSGSLHYHERGLHIDDYLWGNAAFALAAALVQEFDRCGWFADARRCDLHTPGFTQALFAQQKYAFAPLPLTDIIVTDQRQRVLAAMGFTSLAQCWNTAWCEFPTMPSLYAPPANADSRAAAAIQLACQLPMMLGASRFAHCIKVMMREKIGSFATAADCERHIDNWLRQYTIASSGHDAATLTRFPLQDANVTINEDRSQPGRYWCTISLTPHHRIDGVDAQIRLTSELMRMAV